ncbi:hypothetical protein V8C37DRAFT_375774 [Trichoderma ceciliae]
MAQLDLDTSSSSDGLPACRGISIIMCDSATRKTGFTRSSPQPAAISNVHAAGSPVTIGRLHPSLPPLPSPKVCFLFLLEPDPPLPHVPALTLYAGWIAVRRSEKSGSRSCPASICMPSPSPFTPCSY